MAKTDDGIVIVDCFDNDEDHKAFGRNMGEYLEEAGMPGPDHLEHLAISKVRVGSRAESWLKARWHTFPAELLEFAELPYGYFYEAVLPSRTPEPLPKLALT